MTRGLLWQALAAAVGLVILLALGVWQLERLQWKEGLIARVTAGMTAAPAAAPSPSTWPNLDVGSIEYEPVAVRGHFLNDREIFANATLTEPKGKLGGYGLFVMTPFQTDEGWIVYVDRGFIPRDLKAADTRPGSEIEGETTIAGPIRAPIDRWWFMPADDKTGNEWFSRDPKLYAAAQGFPAATVAPYIVDAKFDPTLPNGLPQGGETIVDFPNDHLGYAITWFGLAACLVGVFGAYALGKIRRRVPASAAG
jgi:surfeit locus 1 family protein